MEPEFSREESLRVIDQMIAQVKQKPRRIDSLFTLLWGYLVFVAATLHWILLQQQVSPAMAPLVWLLTLVGLVVSVFLNRQFKATQRVKTYVDALIRQLWLGFGITFLLLFFVISPADNRFLPLVMLLYGITMWMQGALIKFVPYQVGAIGIWGCGVAAFFFSNDQQLLWLALAVLLGYLIPGHLLLYQTRNVHV